MTAARGGVTTAPASSASTHPGGGYPGGQLRQRRPVARGGSVSGAVERWITIAPGIAVDPSDHLPPLTGAE